MRDARGRRGRVRPELVGGHGADGRISSASGWSASSMVERVG